MFKSRFFKKSGKIVSLLVGATMLFATLAPGAFAFNYNGGGGGSGNKPINCNGYSYTQSTKVLNIYFSKQSGTSNEFDASQFVVTRRADSSHPAFSYNRTSGTGYSGVSDSNLNNGTTVTLTFTNSLATDELYDVTIKAATVADDNLLTLGNYRNRNDFTFTFRTPSSGDTTFSNTVPVVTSTVLSTNVPYEPDFGIIFDRPVSSASASTLLSLSDPNGLVANYKNGGTAVVYDSTLDANAVTGAENYKPFANTANTYFFFPETTKGSTNIAYNRSSSGGTTYSYTLDIPPVTDITGNSFTHVQLGTISFSSASYDQVGWLDNRPTFTDVDVDRVTVNWNASGITGASTPAANRYDVYMSSTSQWDPSAYSVVATDLTTTSYTKTSLSSGVTYYFRIVPKYSGSPAYPAAGFSAAGTVTTL